MTLYTTCNHCNTKHYFRSYYETRINYKMHEGAYYQATCTTCNQGINQHVNMVFATYTLRSYILMASITTVLTLIAATVVFAYSPNYALVGYNRPFYFLPVFPIIILLMYRSIEKSKIDSFNRSRV